MRRLLLSFAALAAASGAPALAQEQAHDQRQAAPPAQAQIQHLREALRLRPDQQDAWRAYQSAIAPDPQQAAAARQAGLLMPNLPTPRRLALIRAQMQASLTAFDRVAQAVDAFYAGLSPDQQRIFDEQTAQQGQGQPGQQR